MSCDTSNPGTPHAAAKLPGLVPSSIETCALKAKHHHMTGQQGFQLFHLPDFIAVFWTHLPPTSLPPPPAFLHLHLLYSSSRSQWVLLPRTCIYCELPMPGSLPAPNHIPRAANATGHCRARPTKCELRLPCAPDPRGHWQRCGTCFLGCLTPLPSNPSFLAGFKLPP